MLTVTAVLTAVGVARVHMRTRVLELGAEISDLTADQARLLDHRRRLEAERAYLRHPDRILELARDRLHMVPIRPERVQRIKLLRGDGEE
jgi:cell division protein FtsL